MRQSFEERDRAISLTRTLKMQFPELKNKKLSDGFLIDALEEIEKSAGDISWSELLVKLAKRYPKTLDFMRR